MTDANHYRMQLLGDAADNPDQRIAEDVRQFIDVDSDDRTGPAERGRHAGLVRRHPVGSVGGRAAACCSASTYDIPGYLLWAALIYAVVGTAFTHLIGRPLDRAELPAAALRGRFPLQSGARARELRADRAAERRTRRTRPDCCMRFGNVVANWMAIMSRQKKLTFLTAGYTQAAVVFPYIMVSPAYFAGVVQLGGLMQTANAFGQRAGRAVGFRQHLSQPCRMARGRSNGWPDSTSRSSPREQRPRRRPLSTLAPRR